MCTIIFLNYKVSIINKYIGDRRERLLSTYVGDAQAAENKDSGSAADIE